MTKPVVTSYPFIGFQHVVMSDRYLWILAQDFRQAQRTGAGQTTITYETSHGLADNGCTAVH
jgi:hypothetical protein